MNTRKAEFLATQNFTSSGTKTVDIKTKDPISRIAVIVEATNTSYTPTNHPMAILKTLEIVDGADVIASMTGYAAQAMAYADSGKCPHNELNYENAATIRACAIINFGRHLFDTELALDPSRYRNPQIKLEHDYSLGGCSPSSVNLRVVADMFDEKAISPVGFLYHKEVKSFTPAAGTAEYIDLPCDMPIRKILVMNVNDNEEPDVQFEDVKLTEDEGKRTIVNCKCMDLIRDVHARYGRFGEYVSGRCGTTAVSYYLTHCKDIMRALFASSGTAGYDYGAWSGGRKRAVQMSASVDFGGEVSGLCPHGSVPIFCGNQEDINDWWDVTKIGEAELILTPRSSSCDTNKTTDVIVQSLKRY